MSTALRHHYRPRGQAARLMEYRGPEVLLSGPAGTGKSRACLEKLHALMLLNPGARGLILRKTLASLGSTGLVTWREHVAKESIEAGDVVWYGGSQQESPQYRYTNGSVVVVGGMDKATRIMSSEYDVVYVQEAIELTETDWESITTRLRNGKISFQQLMADTNPDVPTHWLKVRADSGKVLMLESRHEDNPVLVDDAGSLTPIGADYIGKLDNLTGVRYQRLRKGLWVAAEGIIYEEWDPALHLIDHFPIPQNWQRYWSVDFGYVNPMVVQMWAEDPDGRLYLYRELYRTKRTVAEMAELILKEVTAENPDFQAPPDGSPVPAHKRRGEWLEPKPRLILADHDAEGRAVLERELGRSTKAAKKDVLDGIQALQQRLKRGSDSRPRLFILRDARVGRDPELVDAKKPTSTEEEVPGYIWDVGAGKKIKEQPLKENDHGCDAARYLVMHRDPRSRPSIRFAK